MASVEENAATYGIVHQEQGCEVCPPKEVITKKENHMKNRKVLAAVIITVAVLTGGLAYAGRDQEQPHNSETASDTTAQPAPAEQPVATTEESAAPVAQPAVVAAPQAEPTPEPEAELTVQEQATAALVDRGQNNIQIACFARLMDETGEWSDYQERIDYILGKYISICSAERMYQQRQTY